MVKIGQKYRGLHMKTCLSFNISGYMKTPYNRSLRVKWYQAFRKLRRCKHYSDVPYYYIIGIASFVI